MKHKDKKKRIIMCSSVIVLILGGSALLGKESKETKTVAAISENDFKDELMITPLNNDMKIIRPEKETIETSEQTITFSGMSDPNMELKLNGEKIDVFYSGNFILEKNLEVGTNTFIFTLGDKSLNYTVNKTEKTIQSVSPAKIMECMEDSLVEISAKAYCGAEVTAIINGEEIPLTQVESEEYIAARGTTYAKYSGFYHVPAVSEDSNVGKVQFVSKYNGKESKVDGGSVIIKNKNSNLTMAKVKSDRAFTFSDNNLSVTPLVNSANLPKDTMDYITCTTKLDDKEYVNLSCGKRVKLEDVDIISNGDNIENEISKINVSQRKDKTIVKINTLSKTPYDLKLADLKFKDEDKQNYSIDSYEVSKLNISFALLKSIAKEINFEDNSLFESAEVNENNEISLKLKKDKIYCGHDSYYDAEGNLIIEFRNAKSNLNEMTIVLDPGHGLVKDNVLDSGALGYNDINENMLNYDITFKLKDKLEKKGAKVIVLDTKENSYPLKKRGLEGKKNDADLYISIHNNSGASGKINATETYYYTPYSMNFAKNINESLSECYKDKIFGNSDIDYSRGHKYNDFTVTLEKTNPSILVEIGYIENPVSFDKLIREKYQEEIATSIVNGIENSIK
ncbi:MAG: N-acetylmuramoyl-L-alanine amidase [Clostridiaceae bacterium]|nr:N-acetylmuramoyl-L-alanine amidase [Clostridiaceae bacterium]